MAATTCKRCGFKYANSVSGCSSCGWKIAEHPDPLTELNQNQVKPIQLPKKGQ